MLYRTDIANLALGHLGVSLGVTDITTDNTNQAKIIRRFYSVSLETLLEEHDWNFLSKSAPLNLISEVDIGQVTYYNYAYPSDAVIIRQIAEDGVFSNLYQYQDEKRKWQEVAGVPRLLRTEVENAHAKYTYKLQESEGVPNFFGRALAAQIAIDIGPSLVTNNFPKIRDTLMSMTKNEISRGMATDISTQPIAQDSFNPFLRARMY